MKTEKRNVAFRKNGVKRNLILVLLCAAMLLSVLGLFVPVWINGLRAKAFEIPDDYGTDYGVENLEAMNNNDTFEGIICSDKEHKEYNLVFSEAVNGFVTLARISHTSSLDGYVFTVNYGGLISLKVNFDENKAPVSAGSFFGIGNDTYPFKGQLKIGGGQDTAIAVADGGWRYLFNHLSNEASVVSNGKILYSSNLSSGGDLQESNSFVFCKKLTVTKNDQPLDISGFRFESSDGVVVHNDGPTALFAGEVVKGAGDTFSVDFSTCLTTKKYTVKSDNDDAAGLIASIGEGVKLKVKLPRSFSCDVSSNGTQKNVGFLVGTNLGTVTFTGGTVEFTGSLEGGGSSGIIGANNGTGQSKAIFDVSVNVHDVTAKGLRAGGILGTNKGNVELSDVIVQNCEFIKSNSSTNGRLGGVIGSIDNASVGIALKDGASISLIGNSFSFSDSCYAGGYIGYWNCTGASVERVSVKNATFSCGGTLSAFGGYIGNLEASGNFSLSLSRESSFNASGLSAGVYGGVIGQVSNTALSNSVTIAGDGVETCTVKNVLSNERSATVGGVVGKINASTYVQATKFSLDNDIKNANPSARYETAADVVGYVATKGVLDLEYLTLTEKNGSVLVGKTEAGSVVRLGGAIRDNSEYVNNIVYRQDCSLIYKDGTNSGTDSRYDDTYSGKDSRYNDIGNYGQVIRNDTLNVISMDAEHQVFIGSTLKASESIAISNAADFAKLAITFYTKGAISGVDGFTVADYSDLLSKTINITDDISLADTGIEQLTPSNSGDLPYKGTLNGNGRTVTLAIGQNLSGNNNGVKSLSAACTNNERRYLGLFSTVENATVNNLKIGGAIKTQLYDSELNVGALAGVAKNGLTVSYGGVFAQIDLTGDYNKSNSYLYAGGLVGKIESASALTVNNFTLSAVINDKVAHNANNLSRLYWGGLCGYATYTGNVTIDFTNDFVQTQITQKGAYSLLQTGGLIGVLSCNNYVAVDMGGTTADVSLTTSGATDSVGGILGYIFRNCHVKNLNGSFKGEVDAGAASLGGLIHTLVGRLSVTSVFSLSGSKFTTTKANAENCGLLLSDGKEALVSVACAPSGFDGVEANKFDLFIGENIVSYSSVGVAQSGGILTIETEDALGKVPQNSGWFSRIGDRQNEKTRYYFNVLGLKDRTNVQENLLYWHVYDYAINNLLSGVQSEFLSSIENDINISQDVDMTGYSFYPTQKESVTVNFNGYGLTFSSPSSATQKQFFGMQAGLLLDVSASKSNSTVVLQNMKLRGNIPALGDSLGSGALICGTVFGSQAGVNQYVVNLTVQNVVLDGLQVDGDSDYRPLLINNLASYVTATISNITQNYQGQTSVASCLIGHGGTRSSYIYVTLKNIVLDGSASSVFTRSTLFYDVSYVNGAGSFLYNFTFDEDWGEGTPHKVTYGAELYFDEEQQKYFDREIFVNPVKKPDTDSVLYKDFQDYLPYVYVGFNTGNSTNRNLSVNRKSADFIVGFGTYENPYVISTAKQLIDLSKWLSGTAVFNEDWQINFPQGDWSSVDTLNLTGCYVVKMQGGKLLRSDDTSEVLSTEVLLSYLSGAYYKIGEEDLTLTSGFAGLGSTTYPFHGVVHGNGKTITLSSPESAITETGYGFVNVANGCAIYGLKISYGDIALSTGAFTSEMVTTSAPNATALTTSIPHFGGAIAWIVGGDNLLQSVTVSVDSVTGSCTTVFGNYVGLISGGGVLLDGLGKINGEPNNSKNLYHNNYIGRVLQGYAIAVGVDSYNNGKTISGLTYGGDFLIPSIAKASLTGHSSGYNDGTFSLANGEELLLFSFAINSGAFSGANGYAYGKTSLSRSGDYSGVGGAHVGIENGRYVDDTNTLSILAKYFGLTGATDLSSIALTIKLTGDTYDMKVYGNAFRGMSGVYGKSPIFKIQSFGKESGKATISVNMNMPQYASLQETADTANDFYDKDSINYYGLIGRTSGAVTFNNLELSGNICVTTINNSNEAKYLNKSPEYSVGGLLGQNAAGTNVTVNNVSMNDFTVTSPGYAGGFVGYYSGGTLTVNNTGERLQTVTVKGQRHTGGCVGYFLKGTANITGFVIDDSIVETVVRAPEVNKEIGVGGVVGAIGGSAKLTMQESIVRKTAVVFFANYKSTSDKISTGGLLGWASDAASLVNVTATNCTVDGCVIFSLGNFSGSSFPYDAFKGSESTLSGDVKNNLVYNGEKQSSVTILAYFLECKSSTSDYSIGSAGGLIGSVRTNVSLSGCTVTATAAPMAIASLNNVAGLVAEQRAGTKLTVENCTIRTNGHDMFIMGDARSAGIMAYRSGSGTFTVTNFNVVGSQKNPVRIVQFMYSTTEAGGLFGDVGKVGLTVTNCRISNCIIAGAKASAIHTTTRESNCTLTNIHVDNSLIYSRSNYSGGLFFEYTATMTVEGAYLGNNYVIGYSGAGGLIGTATSGSLNGKYVILDDNTVCKGNQASNYTFAASDLESGAAASTLYNTDTPNTSNNVGLIAGNNAGTIKIYAVSCSLPSSIETPQKNFGSGTNASGFVIYNAYGAKNAYAGYQTVYDKTPQQVAIENMNRSFVVNGQDMPLYGDSVTDGTPETINRLAWWIDKNFSLSDSSISKLGDMVTDATVNGDLQLFCLSDNTHNTMTGYLNMLTGGGFGSIDKNLISITSARYSLDSDGSMTEVSGDGSIVYSGDRFKVGVYDNLEGENKTLTVLTVTFKEKKGESYVDVYTMHLAIYYHRAVNLKTFVMPLEGEQYYLPLFTSVTEPSGSMQINVSFGSPFTLYVEYDYNDVAMKLEDMTNFNKRIELTGSDGQTDVNAKIESGTMFVLIDLNSANAAGYSFYTLKLTESKRYIDFNDFKNGTGSFGSISLSEIGEIGKKIENRLCKDTDDSGCIYTEKYLLVVFPVESGKTNTYNMKAVLDEEQRQEKNIVVKRLKEVYGQVTVWTQPEMASTASYADNTADGKIFSYLEGETIRMQVENNITYPNGYVNTVQSQGGAVYETHILRIKDSQNNDVEFPQRTVVKVVDGSGNVIFKDELDSASAQVSFSMGNVLTRPNKSYTVEIDFSHVNRNDFYRTFLGSESTAYALVDSMYLSVKEGTLGVGPVSAEKTYYVKSDSKVKLAVVPNESSFRNLGINLSQPDDETNSGVIDFSISASFDSIFGNNFTQAEIKFSVSKKVYHNGKYEYVALTEEESGIWTVYKNDSAVTSDTLTIENNEASGTYRLVIDKEHEKLQLTNYRLTVSLTADGTEASDYFVFLICRINTEIDN